MKSNENNRFKPLVASSLAVVLGFSVGVATPAASADVDITSDNKTITASQNIGKEGVSDSLPVNTPATVDSSTKAGISVNATSADVTLTFKQNVIVNNVTGGTNNYGVLTQGSKNITFKSDSFKTILIKGAATGIFTNQNTDGTVTFKGVGLVADASAVPTIAQPIDYGIYSNIASATYDFGTKGTTFQGLAGNQGENAKGFVGMIVKDNAKVKGTLSVIGGDATTSSRVRSASITNPNGKNGGDAFGVAFGADNKSLTLTDDLNLSVTGGAGSAKGAGGQIDGNGGNAIGIAIFEAGGSATITGDSGLKNLNLTLAGGQKGGASAKDGAKIAIDNQSTTKTLTFTNIALTVGEKKPSTDTAIYGIYNNDSNIQYNFGTAGTTFTEVSATGADAIGLGIQKSATMSGKLTFTSIKTTTSGNTIGIKLVGGQGSQAQATLNLGATANLIFTEIGKSGSAAGNATGIANSGTSTINGDYGSKITITALNAKTGASNTANVITNGGTLTVNNTQIIVGNDTSKKASISNNLTTANYDFGSGNNRSSFSLTADEAGKTLYGIYLANTAKLNGNANFTVNNSNTTGSATGIEIASGKVAATNLGAGSLAFDVTGKTAIGAKINVNSSGETLNYTVGADSASSTSLSFTVKGNDKDSATATGIEITGGKLTLNPSDKKKTPLTLTLNIGDENTKTATALSFTKDNSGATGGGLVGDINLSSGYLQGQTTVAIATDANSKIENQSIIIGKDFQFLGGTNYVLKNGYTANGAGITFTNNDAGTTKQTITVGDATKESRIYGLFNKYASATRSGTPNLHYDFESTKGTTFTVTGTAEKDAVGAIINTDATFEGKSNFNVTGGANKQATGIAINNASLTLAGGSVTTVTVNGNTSNAGNVTGISINGGSLIGTPKTMTPPPEVQASSLTLTVGNTKSANAVGISLSGGTSAKASTIANIALDFKNSASVVGSSANATQSTLIKNSGISEINASTMTLKAGEGLLGKATAVLDNTGTLTFNNSQLAIYTTAAPNGDANYGFYNGNADQVIDFGSTKGSGTIFNISTADGNGTLANYAGYLKANTTINGNLTLNANTGSYTAEAKDATALVIDGTTSTKLTLGEGSKMTLIADGATKQGGTTLDSHAIASGIQIKVDKTSISGAENSQITFKIGEKSAARAAAIRISGNGDFADNMAVRIGAGSVIGNDKALEASVLYVDTGASPVTSAASLQVSSGVLKGQKLYVLNNNNNVDANSKTIVAFNDGQTIVAGDASAETRRYGIYAGIAGVGNAFGGNVNNATAGTTFTVNSGNAGDAYGAIITKDTFLEGNVEFKLTGDKAVAISLEGGSILDASNKLAINLSGTSTSKTLLQNRGNNAITGQIRMAGGSPENVIDNQGGTLTLNQGQLAIGGGFPKDLIGISDQSTVATTYNFGTNGAKTVINLSGIAKDPASNQGVTGLRINKNVTPPNGVDTTLTGKLEINVDTANTSASSANGRKAIGINLRQGIVETKDAEFALNVGTKTANTALGFQIGSASTNGTINGDFIIAGETTVGNANASSAILIKVNKGGKIENQKVQIKDGVRLISGIEGNSYVLRVAKDVTAASTFARVDDSTDEKKIKNNNLLAGGVSDEIVGLYHNLQDAGYGFGSAKTSNAAGTTFTVSSDSKDAVGAIIAKDTFFQGTVNFDVKSTADGKNATAISLRDQAVLDFTSTQFDLSNTSLTAGGVGENKGKTILLHNQGINTQITGSMKYNPSGGNKTDYILKNDGGILSLNDAQLQLADAVYAGSGDTKKDTKASLYDTLGGTFDFGSGESKIFIDFKHEYLNPEKTTADQKKNADAYGVVINAASKTTKFVGNLNLIVDASDNFKEIGSTGSTATGISLQSGNLDLKDSLIRYELGTKTAVNVVGIELKGGSLKTADNKALGELVIGAQSKFGNKDWTTTIKAVSVDASNVNASDYAIPSITIQEGTEFNTKKGSKAYAFYNGGTTKEVLFNNGNKMTVGKPQPDLLAYGLYSGITGVSYNFGKSDTTDSRTNTTSQTAGTVFNVSGGKVASGKASDASGLILGADARFEGEAYFNVQGGKSALGQGGNAYGIQSVGNNVVLTLAVDSKLTFDVVAGSGMTEDGREVYGDQAAIHVNRGTLTINREPLPTLVSSEKLGELDFNVGSEKEDKVAGVKLVNGVFADNGSITFKSVKAKEKAYGIYNEESSIIRSGEIKFNQDAFDFSRRKEWAVIENQGSLTIEDGARIIAGTNSTSIQAGIFNGIERANYNLGNLKLVAKGNGTQAYGIYSSTDTAVFNVGAGNNIDISAGNVTSNVKAFGGSVVLKVAEGARSNIYLNTDGGAIKHLFAGENAYVYLSGTSKARRVGGSSSVAFRTLELENLTSSNGKGANFIVLADKTRKNQDETNHRGTSYNADGLRYTLNKLGTKVYNTGGSDRIVVKYDLNTMPSVTPIDNGLYVGLSSLGKPKEQKYVVLAQVDKDNVNIAGENGNNAGLHQLVTFNGLKNDKDSVLTKSYHGFDVATVKITRHDLGSDEQRAVDGEDWSNVGAVYVSDLVAQDVRVNDDYVEPTLGVLSAGFNLFSANLNSLSKRMGDLRNNDHSQGVWARVFVGSQTTSFGAEVTSTYQTVQAGYDYAFALSNANNYLGVALSYICANASQASTQYFNPLNGAIESGVSSAISNGTEVALYNSYIADSGLYSDTVAKIGYVTSDANMALQSNTYNIKGIEASISEEVGYRFALGADKEWSITPQAELAYAFMNSQDYTQRLSDGSSLKSAQDAISLLKTRIGAAWGYDFKKFTQGKSVNASLYLGTFYAYDYIAGGDVTLTTNNGTTATYNNYQSSGKFVLNVGTNVEIKDNARIYVDFEKSFGGKIQTDYQVSLGVRFSFGDRKVAKEQKEEEKKTPALKLQNNTDEEQKQEEQKQ